MVRGSGSILVQKGLFLSVSFVDFICPQGKSLVRFYVAVSEICHNYQGFSIFSKTTYTTLVLKMWIKHCSVELSLADNALVLSPEQLILCCFSPKIPMSFRKKCFAHVPLWKLVLSYWHNVLSSTSYYMYPCGNKSDHIHNLLHPVCISLKTIRLLLLCCIQLFPYTDLWLSCFYACHL